MSAACETTVARPEIEEIFIDTVFETLLLPRVVAVTVEDAIARQEVVLRHKALREQDRARERLAEGVYESLVEREVKMLLKNELELQYFARLTHEQLLTKTLKQAISEVYFEEVAIDRMTEEMLENSVMNEIIAIYGSE